MDWGVGLRVRPVRRRSTPWVTPAIALAINISECVSLAVLCVARDRGLLSFLLALGRPPSLERRSYSARRGTAEAARHVVRCAAAAEGPTPTGSLCDIGCRCC